MDLGCGFGTFKKLISQTKIKDNFFINIGNSYIVFTFGDDEKKNYNSEILYLKVFSPNINYERISFNPLYYNTKKTFFQQKKLLFYSRIQNRIITLKFQEYNFILKALY